MTLLLVGSPLLTGCGPNRVTTPRPLPPSGVWEIVLFENEDGRPQVISQQVWMGNEVLFLIVPDFLPAGGGGGSGGSSYEAHVHGKMFLPDGVTQLKFRAETINGDVETVTIADTTYNLQKGRLFFVSSANGDFDVKQIGEDTRSLTPQPEDPKELETFLRSVAEFENFLPTAGKTP